MRPDDLRKALQHVPFRLVRLHLTGGRTFEITHPDMAIVTRSTVMLPLSVEDGLPREAVIALVHIVWLEIVVDEEGA